MASSFQTYIDRENIGNSVLKNNTSKTAQGLYFDIMTTVRRICKFLAKAPF